MNINTSSAIERVLPQSDNGIELYVSGDNKQCGVSQSGLANLCGVSEAAMRQLLADLPKMSVITGQVALVVDDIYISGLTSNQQARVVRSHVAGKVIYYFALTSQYRNETAGFSLGKFMEIGIDRWIKNSLGVEDGAIEQASVASALQQVQSQLKDVNEKLAITTGYRAVREDMVGLRRWLETLTEVDLKILAAGVDEDDGVTLSQWAEEELNLSLSRSDIHTLANMVSTTYKVLALKQPKKMSRVGLGKKRKAACLSYPSAHFPLIRHCYESLINPPV